MEAVEDINKLDPIPERFNVGVAVIGSEKVALMITKSELDTIWSVSSNVKTTVGAVLSKIKVILSFPE